jgi:flagellar biosynthesis protein FlhF
MNLRTYRARTMSDCLAEVKKDLGRDAVILHTRHYKVGGWLGFGGRPMVEITASDGVNVVPRERKSAPVGRVAAAKAYGGPGSSGKSAVSEADEPFSPARFFAERMATVAEAAPTAAAAQVSAAQEVARLAIAPAPAAAGVSSAMEQELAAIKKMVGQVLQCSRPSAGNSMPEALFQDYVKLLESEVASEIADEIVSGVRDELTAAELADGQIVHQTVLRRLAAIIPTEDSAGAGAPAGRKLDSRPLTIALVGPTGVGKTTTVAKLAATYKLRHGKKVGLVTSDTYRIAAVDQLRTYAEIIGLPLKVAMSPQEMASVCHSLGDCDVILIDTAGRSQKDSGRLEELRQYIAAANPHETHLVLSSAASESVLVEAAQRFAQVNPDRVIFTKLDEAVNFGVLVTVARKVSLKLSYVTTGQEVPDHIEVGQSERLARLLLDGGSVR